MHVITSQRLLHKKEETEGEERERSELSFNDIAQDVLVLANDTLRWFDSVIL